MKIKTFFVTFILFLSAFFASMLLISYLFLNSQVSAAKEQAVNEHHLIAVSMGNELTNMMQKGARKEDAIKYLHEIYAENYAKRNGYISIYKNDELLYSSLPQNMAAGPSVIFTENSITTILERFDDREYVIVSGVFPDTGQEYSIQYSSDISPMIRLWKNMEQVLFWAGIGFSLIVAVVLLFMLNLIFRPLAQVIDASASIAAGDYEKRIVVAKNHDLARLADQFNHMVEQVQGAIERLFEDARQKQQFIDNFSHEIRTPLTSVYGFAEYIQKSAITEEELIKTTGYIMEDSRHILNIAARLLDLATLKEQGIVRQDYPVDELYNSAGNQLWKKINEKRIVLIRQKETETISGDKELLQSLLVNLTANAIDASQPEGTIIWRCYPDADTVVLSVSDQGMGIPEDEIEKINEPFYRVDKSRSRENGNAGLGLAICAQIAAAHNARIIFSSEIDRGTEVKVIFPLQSQERG